MNAPPLNRRDRDLLALVATFPLAATRTLALLAGYGAARDGWRALDRLRGAGLIVDLRPPGRARPGGARWWPTRAGRCALVPPQSAGRPRPSRQPERPAPRLLDPDATEARDALHTLAALLLLEAATPVTLHTWERRYRAGRAVWPARLGFATGEGDERADYLLLPIAAHGVVPASRIAALDAWALARAAGLAGATARTAADGAVGAGAVPRLVIAAPATSTDTWRAALDDALRAARLAPGEGRVLTWAQIDTAVRRGAAPRVASRVTVAPDLVEHARLHAGMVGDAAPVARARPPSPLGGRAGEHAGRIVGLLARHPFLTVGQVATLQGLPTASTRRRCARLRAAGLLRVADDRECPATTGRAGHLEATRAGLRLAAARDGLTLAAALAREGFAGGGPDDPHGARPRLLATFAHTQGCAAFVVALARAGRTPGATAGRLLDWRNVVAAGATHARPDAALRWRRSVDGAVVDGWLEVDRATERGAAVARKLGAYAREVAGWGAAPLPTLLIVTTTAAAEARLARYAAWARARWRALADLTILLTTTARLADDPAGPLGAVWRCADEVPLRCRWMS